MALSSAPAVKAALVTRLAADALVGGAGVQVIYGHPYPSRPGRELVSVGRTRPASGLGERPAGHTPRYLGGSFRVERYTIDLWISVLWSSRDSEQAVEARAYAIGDAIDANLRAWWATSPAAFDGIADWVVVSSVEDDAAVSDAERESIVKVELSCSAKV